MAEYSKHETAKYFSNANDNSMESNQALAILKVFCCSDAGAIHPTPESQFEAGIEESHRQ